MEMKIELVPVPVTDVDAAIDFYVNKAGFVLDHDHQVNDDVRFVQLTPKGSACSIVIGKGVTEMTPGTQSIQVVVKDAKASYDELSKKGVKLTDVVDMPWGIFTYFSDPDGNNWALQQMHQQ